MSENDKALIDKAWDMSCFYWDEIDNLIEQAESQEAKEELRVIKKHKYHLDAYKANL